MGVNNEGGYSYWMKIVRNGETSKGNENRVKVEMIVVK